jgi:hypothetical protein
VIEVREAGDHDVSAVLELPKQVYEAYGVGAAGKGNEHTTAVRDHRVRLNGPQHAELKLHKGNGAGAGT